LQREQTFWLSFIEIAQTVRGLLSQNLVRELMKTVRRNAVCMLE